MKEKEDFIPIYSYEIEKAINLSIEQIGISETAKIIKKFNKILKRKEKEKEEK